MKSLRIMSMLLVVILSIMFPVTSLAEGNFEIKNYDVHVVVHEDNSYRITETIQVEFASESHGIIRNIKHKGETDYYINDQWVTKRYAHDVENVHVEGYNYTVKKSGDYSVVKIGDKNAYVNGLQEYVISYDYSVGDDQIELFDQFYYNLIGTEWNAIIEEAHFTIEMPKPIDAYYVSFTAGFYGDESQEAVSYTVDGNIIEGDLVTPLYSNEGVTLRVEMEEGYYDAVVPVSHFWRDVGYDIKRYFYPVSMTLIVLISLILWYAFGKDKKSVPVISFAPPQGLNPAEIGYIIDGTVDNKDVISLILYWANKSYLRIESENDDITLVKLKELDSTQDAYQSEMFDALFKSGDNVRLKDLKNFGDVIESTRIGILNHFKNSDEHRVYTEKSETMANVFKIVSILPVFLAFLKLAMDYPVIAINLAVILGLAFAIGMSIFTAKMFDVIRRWHSTTPTERIKKLLLWGGLKIALLFVFIIAVAFIYGKLMISLIAIILMNFLIHKVVASRRKTVLGRKLMRETLGFREFLHTAEKDKLNELLRDNPQYFYDIVPYAYVLGVTDMWCKKFESMAIATSSGLGLSRGGYQMDPLQYQRLLRESMSVVETKMGEKTKSSFFGSKGSGSYSSSSIGGSGYTGGGAGGGGGDSW